jgi:hypothetical protein
MEEISIKGLGRFLLGRSCEVVIFETFHVIYAFFVVTKQNSHPDIDFFNNGGIYA